jgi:flagella basal body P-ring formation protein FlgA
MRLTATGRALENGSRGEVVRVVNTMSKKTVSGQVVAAETVAVRP